LRDVDSHNSAVVTSWKRACSDTHTQERELVAGEEGGEDFVILVGVHALKLAGRCDIAVHGLRPVFCGNLVRIVPHQVVLADSCIGVVEEVEGFLVIIACYLEVTEGVEFEEGR